MVSIFFVFSIFSTISWAGGTCSRGAAGDVADPIERPVPKKKDSVAAGALAVIDSQAPIFPASPRAAHKAVLRITDEMKPRIEAIPFAQVGAASIHLKMESSSYLKEVLERLRNLNTLEIDFYLQSHQKSFRDFLKSPHALKDLTFARYPNEQDDVEADLGAFPSDLTGIGFVNTKIYRDEIGQAIGRFEELRSVALEYIEDKTEYKRSAFWPLHGLSSKVKARPMTLSLTGSSYARFDANGFDSELLRALSALNLEKLNLSGSFHDDFRTKPELTIAHIRDLFARISVLSELVLTDLSLMRIRMTNETMVEILNMLSAPSIGVPRVVQRLYLSAGTSDLGVLESALRSRNLPWAIEKRDEDKNWGTVDFVMIRRPSDSAVLSASMPVTLDGVCLVDGLASQAATGVVDLSTPALIP
jgi:hypothetical protein